jgi:hypothetical protein
MNTTYHHHIEDAERELRDVKERYLRRWGWTSTCATPGSYWLWRRDFAEHDAKMEAIHRERKLPSPWAPYGVVTVPLDLAVSMTVRCLDEQPELGCDEG